MVLACKQNGFCVLEGLRRPVDYNDVTVVQSGLPIRLAPQYALPSDGGKCHLRTARARLVDGAANGPGLWRQNDGLHLLFIHIGIVDRMLAVTADDVAEHRIARVPDLTDRAHDTRYRHAQQYQDLRD